jgi:hypothetical protein
VVIAGSPVGSCSGIMGEAKASVVIAGSLPDGVGEAIASCWAIAGSS